MKRVSIMVKNLTSGGAEKQSVLLAKLLAENYKVFYIIFNADKIHQKYLDMLYESPKVEVFLIKGSLFSRLRSLSKYLNNNKIEMIFSYLTGANMYASLVGALSGIKVYIGLRNSQLPFTKMLSDRFLSNYVADKVIVNCFSGMENFTSNRFKKDKMLVIPNCFENILPYKPKQQGSKLRIITVGRFVPQKDYGTALKAISKLKKQGLSFTYDIVGYGILEMTIRQWLVSYDIEDIVTIYINPDHIPQLLDAADIYLSTSLYEGTSNSIMEAMNANLPIVATNVGDNFMLLENEKNGFLCEVGDSDTIANKLSYLLINDQDRVNRGKLSKDILATNYSEELFMERYSEIIETTTEISVK